MKRSSRRDTKLRGLDGGKEEMERRRKLIYAQGVEAKGVRRNVRDGMGDDARGVRKKVVRCLSMHNSHVGGDEESREGAQVEKKKEKNVPNPNGREV